MVSKRTFQSDDVGDGTVLVTAEVMVGPLRVKTEMSLEPAQRDVLFEVLTRARSRDARPDTVKTIASRRSQERRDR